MINKKLVINITVWCFIITESLFFISFINAYSKSFYQENYRINSFLISSSTVFNHINQKRVKAQLQPLKYNLELEKIAFNKIDLIERKQFVSHFIPLEKPKNFSVIAENIAYNYDNIYLLISGWLNSPKHHKAIYYLIFKKTGIAVKEITLNDKKTILVVQEFSD